MEKMNASDFISVYVERASDNIPVEESDYFKDGLLYCGKCNTPKQKRITFLGKTIEPFILCKCKEEERNKIEREDYIRKLREKCFEHEAMREWTFGSDDNANPRMTEIAKGYVDRFPEMMEKNRGLLFFGKTGVGKTFLACCIANALIDKGYSCKFADIPTDYDEVEPFIARVSYPDLLILDDFSSERNTEWMKETVKRVIEERYRARKPIVLTSNLSSAELKSQQDNQKARIYSRLFEMCFPIEFVGDERRRKLLKQDYSDYEEWLNAKPNTNGDEQQ